VSRDGQLGLVILWQHTALDDHGVAVGDNDSGAQAVAAAPRRVVVDDFHHPILAHLFRGSVQSNSLKVATPGLWHENLTIPFRVNGKLHAVKLPEISRAHVAKGNLQDRGVTG